MKINYWLIKSEPGNWSWKDQTKVKKTMWDGVRNYQARNNMKLMEKGDLCFFYHSVKDKEIVGIVEVVREYYPDPTDPSNNFVAVDVKMKKKLTRPVTLLEIKNNKNLLNLPLIKQTRLSVMPIDKNSWNLICKLSNN